MMIKELFLFLIFLIVINCQTILISDCANLNNIERYNSTVIYELAKDIDCLNVTVNPIGINTTSQVTYGFQGTLDGKGYKIKNLNITSNSTNYWGLFASGLNCRVLNLTLEDVTINSFNNSLYVGALFGYITNCTINDIQMITSNLPKNLIQSTTFTQHIGGLIGYAESSNVTSCTVTNTSVCVSSSDNVGGIIGYGSNSNFLKITNVGFPSNSSQAIVLGKANTGGIVGYLIKSSIKQSGVLTGKIFSYSNSASNPGLGGIAGLSLNSNFDQVYVRPTVLVNDTQTFFIDCGGLVGIFQTDGTVPGSFSITNSYSRADSVKCGSNSGGLIGLATILPNTNLILSYCYAASVVTIQDSRAGQVIGNCQSPNVSFSNILFDNQTLSTNNTAVGNYTTFLGNTSATSLSCVDLFQNVNTTFPNSTWMLDRLLIEYNYALSFCNCQSCQTTYPPSTTAPSTLTPSTLTPSTLTPIPSTLTPSTLTPSTFIPSTLTPSTLTPSTLIPSTFTPSTLTPSTTAPSTLTPSTTEPSTLTPSTTEPSTTTPSTLTPSTLIPSTLIPSTTEPSTLTPSTLIPSTTEPSTTVPSTNTPSTNIPSTYPPSCAYPVNNCLLCASTQALLVNTTQVNVSCERSNSTGAYSWFYNPISGSIVNEIELVLNKTTIFIQGNFTQTSNSSVTFVVSDSQASKLNITGCVSISGNINLVLDARPEAGNKTYDLVSYSCDRQTNITTSQITVTPKYSKSKCDKIEGTAVNSQNTISVSLSSTLGCKGIPTGAIIGIAVGVPAVVLVILVVSFAIYKHKTTRVAKDYISDYNNTQTNSNANTQNNNNVEMDNVSSLDEDI